MFERLERIVREHDPRRAGDDQKYTSGHLRVAAAELLLATALDAAVQHISDKHEAPPAGARPTPRALALAPLLIAPLTAVAHMAHARQPREGTERALKFLNGATLALGGALIVSESLERPGSRRRLGPLGLTSAALLGFAIDAHERAVGRDQDQLRRRAEIVERLVPKRKARLDRVVVHV